MADYVCVQAVVFAGGYGSRMTNVTDHVSKFLLPIANIPLFWYPLNFLHRNNITEVILVTNEKNHEYIKRALADDSLPPLLGLNVDVVCMDRLAKSEDPSAAEEWGTGDVLAHLQDRIQHDLLLVSGDFVSDLSLKEMLKQHYANDSALTCLLAENVVNGLIPGPREKHPKYRDFAAIVPETDQLVFLTPEEDLDENVSMPDVFKTFKKLNLTAKYNDCHVYLMKKSLLKAFEYDRSFSSIKADLIPFLLEQQYARRRGIDLLKLLERSPYDLHAERLSFGATGKRPSDGVNGSNGFRCFAYHPTHDAASIIAHVNTIGAYFEVNKVIIRHLRNLSADITDARRFDPQTSGVNCNESRVSESAKFEGEKTVVSKSVVGAECSVGKSAKISGSVVMRGVRVGASAVITNSIVCPDVEIGEGAQLTSVIVANGQIVNAKTKLTNALVTAEEMEMDMDE
ncbi:Nucleotidyl transferase family protein [Aphelenchoides avenae]|nr:Nucleotidyl transferase family protein [Aphelenchus avenae]